MGTQKMKTNKTLALQAKINTLAKRFEDDEIDRTEHFEGLSLFTEIFSILSFPDFCHQIFSSGFRDNT
jgi:hypothetical protein